MSSQIASHLQLRNAPVGVWFADQRPEGCLRFSEEQGGCVISLLSAAARGRIAAIDRHTAGCGGALIGLGFQDAYREGFAEFLSTGTPEREGEAYKKTPDLVRAAFGDLPRFGRSPAYVVFAPLEPAPGEARPAGLQTAPDLVIFLANADQLSALVVLANYDRPTNDNVIAPFSSGCQSICRLPAAEAEREAPRAVVGLTDVSARPYVDADLLSFTVPHSMYLKMEGNVTGSFLEKSDWRRVRERITGARGQAGTME